MTAFRRSPIGKVCPACFALVLKDVRLWSVAFIIVTGTILMPVGWLLALINGWRLGRFGRGVASVIGSLLARFAIAVALSALEPGFSIPLAVVMFYVFNAATMSIAVIGLRAPVTEQRAAGGVSANRVIPIVLLILPLACFVAVYQSFTHFAG